MTPSLTLTYHSKIPQRVFSGRSSKVRATFVQAGVCREELGDDEGRRGLSHIHHGPGRLVEESWLRVDPRYVDWSVSHVKADNKQSQST